MRITLAPLVDEPTEIVARDGTIYRADPDLTGAEVVYFVRDSENASRDVTIEKWAETISRCMSPYHPEMTTQAVLVKFPVNDLIQIILGFLGRSGQLLSNRAARRSSTSTTTRKAKR